MPWRFIRKASEIALRKDVDLTIYGIENVPSDGPVILAARHFHHLYDGCAVLQAIERPVRIVVTTDWIDSNAGKRGMSVATRSAKWPVVVRTPVAGTPVCPDSPGINRRAFVDCIRLLKAGDALLVFPEGYPNIDPSFTPKNSESDWLPFQNGFVRIVRAMQRQGVSVPVVPVGFAYEHPKRWQCTISFGTPTLLSDRDESDFLSEIEIAVQILSRVK